MHCADCKVKNACGLELKLDLNITKRLTCHVWNLKSLAHLYMIINHNNTHTADSALAVDDVLIIM